MSLATHVMEHQQQQVDHPIKLDVGSEMVYDPDSGNITRGHVTHEVSAKSQEIESKLKTETE